MNRYETTGTCLIGADTAKVNVIAPHRGEEPCIPRFPWQWICVLLWVQSSLCFLPESRTLPSGLGWGSVADLATRISRTQRNGFDLTPEELGEWFVKLQNVGNVHNINLVTPEHVVPQVALSILAARDMGLRIPIIYNTSAFDSLDSLKLLDGLVDIYLPDFKVWAE